MRDVPQADAEIRAASCRIAVDFPAVVYEVRSHTVNDDTVGKHIHGLDPAIARIFMNGEETNNGRAFAHVVSGPNNGTSYTLPLFNAFGGGSWT